MNWIKEIFKLILIILICSMVGIVDHFFGFENTVLACICVILTQLILPKRDDF